MVQYLYVAGSYSFETAKLTINPTKDSGCSLANETNEVQAVLGMCLTDICCVNID